MAFPAFALAFLGVALLNAAALAYAAARMLAPAPAWRHGALKREERAASRGTRTPRASPASGSGDRTGTRGHNRRSRGGRGCLSRAASLAAADGVVLLACAGGCYDALVPFLSALLLHGGGAGPSGALSASAHGGGSGGGNGASGGENGYQLGAGGGDPLGDAHGASWGVIRGLRAGSTVVDLLVRPFFLVVGARLVLIAGELLGGDTEMADVAVASLARTQSRTQAHARAVAGDLLVEADRDGAGGGYEPPAPPGELEGTEVGSGSGGGGGGGRGFGGKDADDGEEDEEVRVNLLDSPVPGASASEGAGRRQNAAYRREERRLRRQRKRQRRVRRCARSCTTFVAWFAAMILVAIGAARFTIFSDSLQEVTSFGVPILAPPATTSVDGNALFDLLPRAIENIWLLLVGGCLLHRLRWPWLCVIQLVVLVALGAAARAPNTYRFILKAGAEWLINVSLVLALRQLALVSALKRGLRGGLRASTIANSDGNVEAWRGDAAAISDSAADYGGAYRSRDAEA